MKSLLQDNDIAMYATHNEVKSAVAEIFTRILKKNIFKCMTSISKNMHFLVN